MRIAEREQAVGYNLTTLSWLSNRTWMQPTHFVPLVYGPAHAHNAGATRKLTLGRCEERVLFEPQAIDQPTVGHVNVVVCDGVINRDVGNQDTTFRHAHR